MGYVYVALINYASFAHAVLITDESPEASSRGGAR